MSSGLQELYQQVILDHNQHPRNFHKLDCPTCDAEGHNPLCGDEIHLYLEVKGDVIKDIGFEGTGCAISKASSSIMTSSIKGKTKQEVHDLFDRFISMITSPPDRVCPGVEMGKLAVFAGVREFPTRIKCASLAWHTLKAALEEKHEIVSTEREKDSYEPNPQP
jgi:nitrogen fixation protein NifU and related proteins